MTPGPNRVLIVTFPEGLGGPQRWIEDLLAQPEVTAGATVEVWRPSGRFAGVAGKFRLFAACRRALRGQHYDWIYLALDLDLAAQIVLMLWLLGRRRIIVHSHAAGFRSGQPLRKRLYQWLAARAVRRVAVSRVAAAEMFGARRASSVSIHPALIDFSRLCAGGSGEALRVDGSAYRFAFVGRVAESKQPRLAIEAFARLCDAGVDATLDMVGDGPLLQLCRDLACSLPCGADIRFHGALERVGNVLSTRVDCLLLPSRYEGQGRVIAEAQFFGCAVICSDAVPEEAFLDDRAVRVVPADDVDEWTEAMAAAARDRARSTPWDVDAARAHPRLGARAGARRFLELVGA